MPIKKPHLEFPERLNIHEQFEDRSVTVTTSDIIRYVCPLFFYFFVLVSLWMDASSGVHPAMLDFGSLNHLLVKTQ